MVKIVAHFDCVVGATVQTPDMGHALFHEEGVNAQADAHQRIPVAHAQPEKFQLLQRVRIRDQCWDRFGIRGWGHRSDPTEHIEMGESDIQGLTASIDMPAMARWARSEKTE